MRLARAPLVRSGGQHDTLRRRATRAAAFGLGKLFGGGDKSDPKPQGRTTLDRLLTPGGGNADPAFPPYTVVAKQASYAIRFYNLYTVVEMYYARREEGYAALGSYFDGSNAEGAAFAYTQPVMMEYNVDGTKVMRMYVAGRRGGPAAAAAASAPPSGDVGAAIAALPAPTDKSVRIGIAGGELVAVAQFDGYITPQSAEDARRRLTAALQADGIQLADADAAGRFRCAQYGAVYQLGERLNELMLQIKAG